MLARVSRVTLVFKEPSGAPEGPAVGGSGPPFPPRRSLSRSSLREGENRRGKSDVNALAFFRPSVPRGRRKPRSDSGLCSPFFGGWRGQVALGSDYPFPLRDPDPVKFINKNNDMDDVAQRAVCWDTGAALLGLK